jgi:hypothetical protein
MCSGDVRAAVLPGAAHVHGGRGLPLPADGLLLRLRHGPPLGLLLPDHRHRLVLWHGEVSSVPFVRGQYFGLRSIFFLPSSILNIFFPPMEINGSI